LARSYWYDAYGASTLIVAGVCQRDPGVTALAADTTVTERAGGARTTRVSRPHCCVVAMSFLIRVRSEVATGKWFSREWRSRVQRWVQS
jgi:hypothetical protein